MKERINRAITLVGLCAAVALSSAGCAENYEIGEKRSCYERKYEDEKPKKDPLESNSPMWGLGL